MAKGWSNFATINDLSNSLSKQEKIKREQRFNDAIRNTKTLSVEALKQHSDELYDKQMAEDEKLLQAFTDKKVKSKTAIRRALRLKKERTAVTENKVTKVEE